MAPEVRGRDVPGSSAAGTARCPTRSTIRPRPRAGKFGWSLARTDYDHDGTPDLYVGQAPHHVPVGDQDGGTYVFDGRDASVFNVLEVPESDSQPSVTGNGGPRLGGVWRRPAT